GLAFMSRGFRPVLLFNTTTGNDAIKDVRPIVTVLKNGSAILQKATLAWNAPPAFLIDSQRLDGKATPGQFDNRWVVFPQDFPSGILLQSQGIRRIVAIQPYERVDDDLAEVYFLWKRFGLEILMTRIQTNSNQVQTAPTEPINLRPVRSVGLMRTLLVY